MSEATDRYLKYLPPALREKYMESRDDPMLNHLSQEISLIDTRIKMLLQQLELEIQDREKIVGDVKEKFPDLNAKDQKRVADYLYARMPENFVDHVTFRRLQQLADSYNENIRKRNIRQADEALRSLFDLIAEGRRIGDVWDSVESSMERRRMMVESEEKRKRSAESYIPVDRVVTIIGILIEVLRGSVDRYVSDKEVRQYILADAEESYVRIVGSHDSQQDFISVD